MIVNRKHGVYKIYEPKGVRGLYLLAETGLLMRYVLKSTAARSRKGLAELFIRRSRR